MAKILITHGAPREGFSVFEGHDVIMPPHLSAFSMEELARYIEDADGVVAFGKLPGEIIRRGKKLKIIANYGAGYDGVDVKAAAECGVPVTNTPDAVTQDTAELALGLMLSVSRRIGELNLRLRKEAPESLFGMGRNMGRSLMGATLGIIGCGRIGCLTAQMAKAFGMRVLGYSRHGADPAFVIPASMDEILQQADIVSLHCPLTEETRGLMGKREFSMMKEGALLINTARGAVIDEEALLEAMECGRIAGAGLDVYPDEPHINPALLRHDRIVCVPHIGTNTEQTRFLMARTCALQILDALSGKRPENIVNGL
ncbi:MAG: dihydrofolate reductase [Clostridia bacterium]|nr:dihydrofolate reductase [Clostridia bacterium]